MFLLKYVTTLDNPYIRCDASKLKPPRASCLSIRRGFGNQNIGGTVLRIVYKQFDVFRYDCFYAIIR